MKPVNGQHVYDISDLKIAKAMLDVMVDMWSVGNTIDTQVGWVRIAQKLREAHNHMVSQKKPHLARPVVFFINLAWERARMAKEEGR